MSALLQLAPTILSFLGGPAGGLAGAALQWLAGKFGAKDSTVEAIKEALQGFKPDDTIALRKLDIEFQQFCMEHNIKVDLAQIDVNKEEAKSIHFFISGWRPAVGWTCATAFAYSYVLLPLLQFLVFTFGTPMMVEQLSKAPAMDIAAMLPVLFGMLGLSSLRTAEKINGAEGNR